MKVSIGTMEEDEYRIVNGLKLPPKRHIVVERKFPPSSLATGTPPTTNIGSTSSEAPSGQKNKSNSSLPFGTIRRVIFEFKERCESDDIFFPEQEKFPQKWAALSKRILTSTGMTPRRQDAIALFDCTILGGCEYGALIDKSGIYTVNEDRELDGYLDWMSFVEKADIVGTNIYEIRICSQPNVGLDIARFDMKEKKVVELFAAILDIVSGGKVRASQVHAISLKERLRDWVIKGIGVLIAIPVLVAIFATYDRISHSPDDTINDVFKSLATQQFWSKALNTEVDPNHVFAPCSESKDVANQIAIRVGQLLVPIVVNGGYYEYDIIKTNKDGDSATVSVKLYNNKKSVIVDFHLKKVKEGDMLDRCFGRWVLHGVGKGQ